MHKALISAATFVLAGLSGPAVMAHTQALQCGHALLTPGKKASGPTTIVVTHDGRISAVKKGYVEIEDAKLVDLHDKFCLPGLIDSHVHLTSQLGPKGRLDAVTNSDADWAMNAVVYGRRTLMAGFTSVQDVGARGDDTIFAVRDAINRGDIAGPRIRAAGQIVSVSGGHGDPRHGYAEPVAQALKSPTICDGADDCRRAVRDNIRKGADLIKITATGGVLSNTAAGTEQQFFDDELQSIVQAAHFMGRQVTAHAHGKAGIEAALRAGVDSIEHGTYLDKDTIALFRQHDAWLIPTVLAGATVVDMANDPHSFLPEPSRIKAKEVGPRMLNMLRMAHEGGVNVAFGTDSGVSHHGDNAREFALMVKAGFTPMEAIKAATVMAAEHLQMSDQVGTLENGKWADIIAVDGDPLKDVRALEDVDFVMKGGRVYKDK